MILPLSLALAAPPPGLDVDAELPAWEARSQALLAGPTGCWELSGTVDLVVAGYLPSTRWTRPERSDHRSTGPFTARIEDGTWVRFEPTLRPVDAAPGAAEELDLPIWPLLGRSPRPAPSGGEGATASVSLGTGGVSVRDQGGAAMNTVHRILEAIDPSTATSYAQWDDAADGVALYQDFPLKDAGAADVVTIRTAIPRGGPVATALDLTFPGRVRLGDGLVKATIFDAQGHVRTQVVPGPDGAPTALPALESLSLGLGALGFTVAFEQKIRYVEARPCAVP